ncbi:MAG TPA: hypothetical protein VHC22_10270 [Pirellulales bacterium]|nr:hypothetical protein [Pirellulales bacterium]
MISEISPEKLALLASSLQRVAGKNATIRRPNCSADKMEGRR